MQHEKKKEWVRKFGTSLFAERLAFVFFCITLISSFLVGVISYQISKDVIVKNSIEAIENAAYSSAASIDSFLKTMDQSSVTIYSDKKLHGMLNCASWDLPNRAVYYKPIDALVKSVKAINPALSFVNIYGVNGLSYTDTYYNHAPDAPIGYNECVQYYSHYGFNQNQATACWIGGQKIKVETIKKNMILNVRYIRNAYTYNITGVMVLGFSEASLYKQYISAENNAYIIDGNAMVVSCRNKQLVGERWERQDVLQRYLSGDEGSILQFTDEKPREYSAAFAASMPNGWHFVDIAEYRDVFSDAYFLLKKILLILLVDAVVFLLILITVSQKMTASVTRLFRVMQQVKQGDLNVRFQAGGGDEISRIGEDLNEMLSQIQEDLLYKERSEKIREISQLKLLQAQINPHLLYNTLDSVYYYLKTGDIGSAQSILNALSSFFKISLSKGEYYVPIRKEIEHIRCYLEIQRMCRDKDITLEVLSPAELLDCMIPKMTLQPIVENSILHGFEGEVSGGLIQIVLEKTEEVLTISLRDNGTGMLAGEVAELNDYLKNASPEAAPQSYGLWNVNQRIRHHFGGESGLSMESEFGEYTVVHIQMDLKKQQEEQKGTEL